MIHCLLAAALQGLPPDPVPAPDIAPHQNILLILADDLGVDSLGMYAERLLPPGSLLPRTPNLDVLRGLGVKFDNFWVTPSCSSTRASIQTGRQAFRTGIGRSISAGKVSLSPCEITIPEMLQELEAQGQHGLGTPYRTSYVGKWHQSGSSAGMCNPVADHGYDAFYGTSLAVEYTSDSYGSWTRVEMDNLAIPPINCTSSFQSTYLLEQQYRDASHWLTTPNTTAPWFQFLAFQAPYKNHHFIKDPALYTVDWYPRLFTIDQGPGIPQDYRRILMNQMLQREAYLAYVEAMDTEIGRILGDLYQSTGGSAGGWRADHGWWDQANVTVIFAGDNGTPGGVAAGTPPFLKSHAKETAYEPGVHVPLLIAGAGVPKVCRGVSTPAYACGVDLFATIGELAAGAPVDFHQLLANPIDGVSLVPVLQDPWSGSVRDHLYSEMFGVNNDTWDESNCDNAPLWTGGGEIRLIRAALAGAEYRLWYRRESDPDASFANGVSVNDELYNLTLDPAESTNLVGPGMTGQDIAIYWHLRETVDRILQ